MQGCRQRLRDLSMSTFATPAVRKEHTPWICVAPENDSPLLVGRVSQDFVQLHSKAVQVSNV